MSAFANEDGLGRKKRVLMTEVADPPEGFAEDWGRGAARCIPLPKMWGLSHPHVPRGDAAGPRRASPTPRHLHRTTQVGKDL